MKIILTTLIRFYQRFFSFDTGLLPALLGLSRPVCPQVPSCSSHALSMIERHGAVVGVLKSIRRALTCTPSKFIHS